MISTFVITLREGLEVAIILAIILAYLKQLGQSEAAAKVWLGTGVAVLISVLAAVGIFFVLERADTGEFQDILEGSLKILAVVILTWMTLWMKKEANGMSGELKAKVNQAVSNGSTWALASLAFISVIREGIETVLFVAGAAQGASTWQTVGGGLLGIMLAAIFGYVLYKGTYRLPLKSFFTVMSVLLIFMAAGLLSTGIHEFQELGYFPEGVEHIWSTKFILDQKSFFGSLLKAIFGYQDSPNLVQVLAYWIYLIGALYAYFKPVKVSS